MMTERTVTWQKWAIGLLVMLPMALIGLRWLLALLR